MAMKDRIEWVEGWGMAVGGAGYVFRPSDAGGVAEAIETGEMDHRKLREVSDNLKHLGKEGPWTEETGIDFLKKTAEGMPIVGGFLKALWD